MVLNETGEGWKITAEEGERHRRSNARRKQFKAFQGELHRERVGSSRCKVTDTEGQKRSKEVFSSNFISTEVDLFKFKILDKIS